MVQQVHLQNNHLFGGSWSMDVIVVSARIVLNVWAIDSTFKTNQFWLPLYAVVAPNEMGIGMLL